MRQVFDHPLLDLRRRRAMAKAEEGHDFLLRRAAEDLVERLALVQRRFAVALDLATPSPLLAQMIAASGQVDKIVRLDRLRQALSGPLSVVGDAECLPLSPASLDLAVSALMLHFVNDLPGALAQIRRALRQDGLFLASLMGSGTLIELRTAFAQAEGEISSGAAPRVAPFIELRDLGALLQRAGFALPVVDQELVVVRYGSMFELMRDLRAMGATNVLIERDRRPLRRSVLLRAAEIYAERFGDGDGRVRASFQFLSLSGWAPHPAQQKPLAPGSAKMRLAEALGSREILVGEKGAR